MKRPQPEVSVALSMRERAEVDTLYARVLAGEHYRVLGVASDAPPDAVQKAYLRVTRWLEGLQLPDRDLGAHGPRVAVVATAVENAFRIVGNPRERLLYDGQRGAGAVGRSVAGGPRREKIPTLPGAKAPTGTGGRAVSRGRAGHRSIGVVDAAGATPSAAQLVGVAEQLMDILDVHLGIALGQPVSLREAAAGPLYVGDPARYAARAEDAEQAGRWADAAVHWHLASLAAPEDSTAMLRAATALRWAGATTGLFDGYARLVRDKDMQSGSRGAIAGGPVRRAMDEHEPDEQPGVPAELPPGPSGGRPASRRPPRR